MVVCGAATYSPFHRSKTHLVYTTEDLRVRFVDRTHFFGRAHPENHAYALPIGKVGLITKGVPPALPGRQEKFDSSGNRAPGSHRRNFGREPPSTRTKFRRWTCVRARLSQQ